MRVLTDAFDYNGWATRQLGNVCREIPAEQLTAKPEWQYESILGLWRHIEQVERVYLGLMGVAKRPEPASELEGCLDSLARADSIYADFYDNADDSVFERNFHVPWFERDFRMADGLFQVLSHSIEHRADVAHFLSRFGYETPPIDYIAYVYLRDGGVMPG